MLHALHCQDCCYENTNERERHKTKFTLGAGAVLHVPHGICLETVFNWLRHRNEAPKSALHFGQGRYRLYWYRFSVPNPTLNTRSQSWLSLYLPHVNTKLGKTAFCYKAPYIWNEVEKSLRLCSFISLREFLNLITCTTDFSCNDCNC